MDIPPNISHYLDESLAAQLHRLGAPRRALFLDRDGIINIDHGYVHDAAQTQWVPGIFELCRAGVEAGYLLVVVTNQAGIARGLYTEDTFLAYTRWLHAEFSRRGASLAATYYCPHHPTEGRGEARFACACRKPEPGMILGAIAQLGLDPGNSVLVGDKVSDTTAGLAAGVSRNILVDPEFTEQGKGSIETVRTLNEAAVRLGLDTRSFGEDSNV